MWALLLLAVIFIGFVFIDLWYFIRFLPFIIRNVKKRVFGLNRISREDATKTTVIEGIVLPSDVDWNVHMNNSKYLREMDFGRIFHVVENGLYGAVRAFGGFIVVGAVTIRYRKSLQLWERFQLRTRILCWDDRDFYYEQRFVNKEGITCAIALVKASVRGTTPREALERACTDGCPNAPPIPSQVEAWKIAMQRSSEALKTEQQKN